ncbi:integrase core domain-containing protein [Blastococcus sp. SYSU DS0616]
MLIDNAMSYRHGALGSPSARISASAAGSSNPDGRGATARPSGDRTLPTEWADATGWTSNDQRTVTLDSWLEHYNAARSHSAPRRPPAGQPTRRVNNLPGHDT